MKMKGNKIFKTLIKLTTLVFKAVPFMLLIDIVLCLFHGIAWVGIVVFQQDFFNKATDLIMCKTGVRELIYALVVLAVVYLVCQVLNGFENHYSEVLKQKIMGHLAVDIHKKIACLSAVDFEDVKKLDDINKADKGKDNAVNIIMVVKDLLSFYLPYFLFMGIYLFVLKPSFVIALFFVFIPTIVSQLIRTRVFDSLEDVSAPIRRENEHYEECIVSREYYKETRCLGAFSFFYKKYIETLGKVQKLKFKLNMKTNVIQLIMQLLTILGYLGILLMLFYAVINQEITIGAFIAVYNSIGMMYENMEEIICEQFGEISAGLGTVNNYINFIEMDEEAGSIVEYPGWGDIVLSDVSFSYPGSNEKALNHVSMILKKGETIAVVGENGSGKSTLIRLLTGLYKPDEGRVTVNGADITEVTNKALFEKTSAVFQRFQKYKMTVRENVCISDMEKMHTMEEIKGAARFLGEDIHFERFPDGYDTMLSKEFDGIDLSGGQWQRLAIARAFIRKHNFIVLDEPTAAIDPYEETRIYKMFAELAKDKSSVIVTHRIGSAHLADRIIVMKGGKIVEIGEHQELMEIDSEYKRLYKAQEKWYT